jgi:hypothetical protein
MKWFGFIQLVMVVVLLASCQKQELEYPCNEVDQAFVPFFGSIDDTYNGIEIGKLNQCNETVDSLETSNQKLQALYDILEPKDDLINPDITAYAAYYDYNSNSRLYPEDIVSYDYLSAYLDTMELSFIYDAILQVESFILYYDDPVEGSLNDFKHSDDYYKLRFYMNDNYLYYVQYHNLGGSQFTVFRAYLNKEEKLIYDILTYYGDDANYTYKYTAYQEGVYGIQAKLREYESYRGILEVKQADFINKELLEYSLSNYASTIERLSLVNEDGIVRYNQEVDGYHIETESYNDDGFQFGFTIDTLGEIETFDTRYNLSIVHGWDYYFQEGLYIDEQQVIFEDAEIFENSVIERNQFLTINQHFELILHDSSIPKDSGIIPIMYTFGSPIAYVENIRLSQEQFFFDLRNQVDLEDVNLIDIWKSLVPNEFYHFIIKNK